MKNLHLAGFPASKTSFATAGAMTAASACLAFLYMAARNLAHLPPMEVAFFGSLFGFVLMAPAIAAQGALPPPTRRMGIHLLRAASGLAAIVCIFLAVRLMPLAEATALSFAAPIFAALGGALFTGETVSRRRWVATWSGFAGVIVILQPGSSAFGTGGAIALLSAVCTAVATLTVRALSRTERVGTIVFYFMTLMIPLSGLAALPFWQAPEPHHWPWLALVGGTITTAQLLLTRALQQADASFAVPFMYTQLVFVSLLGFLLHGETPALTTILGAVIIFASSIYLALAERPSRLRPRHAARGAQAQGRPA